MKLEKDIPAAQLLKWFGDNEDQARLYNPHLRSAAWNKSSRLHKDFLCACPRNSSRKRKLDLNDAAAANWVFIPFCTLNTSRYRGALREHGRVCKALIEIRRPGRHTSRCRK